LSNNKKYVFEKKFYLRYNKFMIVSHRGYTKNYPENTIAAFDAALLAGADAIETDLRLTKDKSVVVSHDNVINLNKNKITISETSITDLNGLLNLNQLFDYIKLKDVSFFLELKDSSHILFEKIVKKIEQDNLWNKVYLIGFKKRIKTALSQQSKYPKLRVCQILKIPHFSLFKMPKKSYAVFFGWLVEIKFSKQLFRILIPKILLKWFKKYYEKHGFKVMVGVINEKKGIEYFQEVGIHDIFTDEVEIAKLCQKHK